MDKPFFLPFVKKEKLTDDCYSFYFKRTGEERGFTPGQYYEMKIPHKKMDERGDARVFTISSSPTEEEFITITTRIIRSSFKIKLGSLQIGESVQFDGPWNDLNFDEMDNAPHVFIGGGIGITPYRSIVKYAIDKKISTRMTLFVSWKSKDEMLFDDFFRNSEKKLSNFAYIPTITDGSNVPKKWNGETGRINVSMIKKHVTQIEESKFYISGPQAMVKSLRQSVADLGVDKKRIVSEDFEGY